MAQESESVKRHFLTLVHSHQPVLLLVALATLVRLLTIGHFGLGVDEAHYVLYGLHPALSYFDHPPLVGWTEWLFTATLGIDTFAARLPAVLIGAAATLLMYGWLFRIFDSKSLAFWGAMALNASFLFNALFMMLMPDTLLFLLIIPIMAIALRIEKENRLPDWLLLGLLMGMAGLAKYTSVLFALALLLYFAYRRRWDILLSSKLVTSVALAVLIVAPVLLWNLQNNWISFAFQSAHVSGHGGLSWSSFGQSVGAQFGAYSPFLFPLAFYGLITALRSPRTPALFLSGIFGLVIMLFFTYNSFFAKALPHWTAPFYLLFIPIGTVALLRQARGWRRYAYGAVSVSMVISLLLYAELRAPFLPFPDYKSIHRDLYGWDTIMAHVAKQITDPATQAAAVTNWSLASRAQFYARPYAYQTFLIDRRFDQFDLWQQGDPEGKDLLFITTHDFKKNIETSMRCTQVQAADTFDLTLNGRKVNTVRLTWCRDFQGRR